MTGVPSATSTENCTSCGSSSPRVARFCPGCGRRRARPEVALEPGLLRRKGLWRLADPPSFPLQTWQGHLVVVGRTGPLQVFLEGRDDPVLQEGVPLEGDLWCPALVLEGLLVVPGPRRAAVFDLAARLSGRPFEPPRGQTLALGGNLVSPMVTDGRRWLAAPVRVGDQCEVRVWEYRARRGLEARNSFRPGGAPAGQDLHAWLVGDHLYAGAGGGSLSGRDLATGEALDTLQVPGLLKSSPVVRGGPVPLVCSDRGALFRLPAERDGVLQPLFHAQGESLWTWVEEAGAVWVVAGSHLYRVDPRGGGETRVPLRDSGSLCPALARGGAFVMTAGGALAAVRCRNGQLEHVGQQNLFEGAVCRSGAPVVLGQTLYTVDPEGNLGAWRAVGEGASAS